MDTSLTVRAAAAPTTLPPGDMRTGPDLQPDAAAQLSPPLSPEPPPLTMFPAPGGPLNGRVTISHPFADITLCTRGRRIATNEDGGFVLSAPDESLVLCGVDGASSENGARFRDLVLEFLPLFLENSVDSSLDGKGGSLVSAAALARFQEVLTLLAASGEIPLEPGMKVSGALALNSLRPIEGDGCYELDTALVGDVRQIVITPLSWRETLDQNLGNLVFSKLLEERPELKEKLGVTFPRNLTLADLREHLELQEFRLEGRLANKPHVALDLGFAKQVITSQLGLHYIDGKLLPQLEVVDESRGEIVHAGDIGLILSDGLTDVIDAPRIVQVVREARAEYELTYCRTGNGEPAQGREPLSKFISTRILGLYLAEQERLCEAPEERYGKKVDDIFLAVFVVGGDRGATPTAEHAVADHSKPLPQEAWQFTTHKVNS